VSGSGMEHARTLLPGLVGAAHRYSRRASMRLAGTLLTWSLLNVTCCVNANCVFYALCVSVPNRIDIYLLLLMFAYIGAHS
jgi:hypothetical protein